MKSDPAKSHPAQICLLLLLLAAVSALTVDQTIARFMVGLNPHIVGIFTFITWFGQGGVILYPAGTILVAAFFLRPRLPSLKSTLTATIDRTAYIFITVAAAGLANDVFKIVFGRARPRFWLAGDNSGFHFFRFGAKFASFPSGHTATSVAAAIAFSVLFPRYRWVFAGFAVLIGISRVVIDAHYLSDVLGGAAVGGAVAWTILIYLRRRNFLSLPPRRIRI
jgi:undecaprenyl-diphosphatase